MRWERFKEKESHYLSTYRVTHYNTLSCICYIFSVNDDTEMLSPGWTEVYIKALQVRCLDVVFLYIFSQT